MISKNLSDLESGNISCKDSTIPFVKTGMLVKTFINKVKTNGELDRAIIGVQSYVEQELQRAKAIELDDVRQTVNSDLTKIQDNFLNYRNTLHSLEIDFASVLDETRKYENASMSLCRISRLKDIDKLAHTVISQLSEKKASLETNLKNLLTTNQQLVL
jgi:hypothetical protein